MAKRNVSFNLIDLQDSNVVTRDISFESVDNRSINFQGLARDGGKAVDDKFEIKRIRMTGIIKDSTTALLDERIDAFHLCCYVFSYYIGL